MLPRPHPLNRGFEWTDHAGPRRRLTPDQTRGFDERGFVVLEGIFDASEVADVTAALDPLEAEVESFLQSRDGGRAFIARAGEITFTPHAVQRSERARAFCGGAVFQDLVHDLIGPNVRLYWDQAVYKKPGADDPFPWHQDNGYTYVEPQEYLTCWVALTDATEENGCPWVVPGLHRRGTLAHEMTDLGWVCLNDPQDAVAAPVRAGGVVLFSSLTPHATGPNHTDEVRKTYIVQFAPEGAEVLSPRADGPPLRTPANAPDRQFPVLVGGRSPA